MQPVSYTHLRSHLAKTMELVCDNHEPMLVHRGKKESVVMISLTDYEAMAETAYLLKSPKNAIRLSESIDEIEQMIAERNMK